MNSSEKRKNYFGLIDYMLIMLSILIIIIGLPVTVFFCVKIIREYERAVIFRLGRVLKSGTKGPGLFFVIPCIDSMVVVDMRTTCQSIVAQEIITKDLVSLTIDLVINLKVTNPISFVVQVEDPYHTISLLVTSLLRSKLGSNSFHEILENLVGLEHYVEEFVSPLTEEWGIQILRAEIKDMKLPPKMQHAMSVETKAIRDVRAKMISAEGEYEISKSLKEAATFLSDSSAFQLKYLQAIREISAETTSTIILPLPLELLKFFGPKKAFHEKDIYL